MEDKRRAWVVPHSEHLPRRHGAGWLQRIVLRSACSNNGPTDRQNENKNRSADEAEDHE